MLAATSMPRPLPCAVLGLGLALGLALPACTRKAPGPEECHALARAWVAKERSRPGRFPGLVLEPPADAVLERTNECLTTPYDRELVECIGAGAAPRGCFAAFVVRRGAVPGRGQSAAPAVP